jgi:hypothetical protein
MPYVGRTIADLPPERLPVMRRYENPKTIFVPKILFM